MTIEYDLPLFRNALDVRIDPTIDAADILARYWNDQIPQAENIDTIYWWLRQREKSAVAPRTG